MELWMHGNARNFQAIFVNRYEEFDCEDIMYLQSFRQLKKM